MRELLLSFFILLSFLISTALAESPYLRTMSRLQATTENGNSSSFRPISSWVGERFVFLPKQKTLQRFGYRDFQIGDDLYKCPTYNEYVGRIARVVSSKKVCDHWDVELVIEDNGQRVSATARSGDIEGIALVSDIRAARDRWLGKTLWYRKTWIETYDEDTGETQFVYLEKNSPVKVIHVTAGWNCSTPVRFVLQTPAGEEGYVDIAWSGTNCSESERKYSDNFEASFFIQDPTKSNKPYKENGWPERMHHHKAVDFSYHYDYGQDRYPVEKKRTSSNLQL